MSEQLREDISAYIDKRGEVMDSVRGLLISHLMLRLTPEEIDPDVALFGSGLGLDSVDVIELIVALESHFGLTFPDVAETPQNQDSPHNFHTVLRSLNTLVDFVMLLSERKEAKA